MKLIKIIIVILIILIVLALLLELPRYLRIKNSEPCKYEKNYHKIPRVKSEERVVVSLSTIPDRIHLLKPTLTSILAQSRRVDEIALNVPLRSRKGKTYDIPEWFNDLKYVKIHRVPQDEGPATKLLPTMRREHPNTRIIVIDDDIVYHSKTVEKLIAEFEKYKGQAAITHFGVSLSKNLELPDDKERVSSFFYRERPVDLLQGFSGFVVAKSQFPEEVFNIRNGPPEAISVDDVWFSGWLRYNKVEIRTPKSFFLRLPIINLGDMRKTPALGASENRGFVSDLKVINWFSEEKGVLPVANK